MTVLSLTRSRSLLILRLVPSTGRTMILVAYHLSQALLPSSERQKPLPQLRQHLRRPHTLSSRRSRKSLWMMASPRLVADEVAAVVVAIPEVDAVSSVEAIVAVAEASGEVIVEANVEHSEVANVEASEAAIVVVKEVDTEEVIVARSEVVREVATAVVAIVVDSAREVVSSRVVVIAVASVEATEEVIVEVIVELTVGLAPMGSGEMRAEVVGAVGHQQLTPLLPLPEVKTRCIFGVASNIPVV